MADGPFSESPSSERTNNSTHMMSTNYEMGNKLAGIYYGRLITLRIYYLRAYSTNENQEKQKRLSRRARKTIGSKMLSQICMTDRNWEREKKA